MLLLKDSGAFLGGECGHGFAVGSSAWVGVPCPPHNEPTGPQGTSASLRGQVGLGCAGRGSQQPSSIPPEKDILLLSSARPRTW